MRAKSRHSGFEVLVRNACEKRVSAQGGFVNEAWPVGCYDLPDDLMHGKLEACALENLSAAQCQSGAGSPGRNGA